MSDTQQKSNEMLTQDIAYIKADILEIKKKLDEKYVSHETFDLTIQSINQAMGMMVKVALFIITPIYGAVIALLFKIFAN